MNGSTGYNTLKKNFMEDCNLKLKDIQVEIAAIHNKMAEINVRGDDTFRMAEALTRCRALVANLANDIQKAENQPDDE